MEFFCSDSLLASQYFGGSYYYIKSKWENNASCVIGITPYPLDSSFNKIISLHLG